MAGFGGAAAATLKKMEMERNPLPFSQGMELLCFVCLLALICESREEL